MSFVKFLRCGAAPTIPVDVYDATTELPKNLTGFTNLSAKAVQVDGDGEVQFPIVVVASAVDGQVNLAGYAPDAFTPGVWDVTISLVNPAGEPDVYPEEAGLLQIEVAE